METAKHTPGYFVWRELGTTDIDAATRFYSEVCGWRIERKDMDGMGYWLLHAGDKQVGGMYSLPKQAPQIAYWCGYVSVESVDGAMERAKAAGATVLMGPMDVPSIGRMGQIRDPQGAFIALYHDKKGDAAPGMPGLGEFCWEQLNTPDPTASKAFYTKAVGWGVVPFPGGGDMEVLTTNQGQAQVASVMKAPPGAPAHWLTYVAVDNLAAVRARVTRGGGKILVERIDVPTVGAISIATDPQGAAIGFFEAPKG